mgnify:CR=1 FL=1
MSTYTARRTPVFRGPAAWSVILPGQEAPIALDADTTADFVIIGAQKSGTSSLYRYLAQHPAPA